MDTLLKKQYARNIQNNLKSSSFYLNMLLRTTSKTISDILELLFNSEKIKATPNGKYEFSADISDNGQEILIYNKDGKEVDPNKYLGILIYLLKYYFGTDKILLPPSAPEKTEKLATDLGLSIIYGSIEKDEQLNEMLKNELYIQERLSSDAIYFAVSLLDYLNFNRLSFNDLLSLIPESYTSMHRINNIAVSPDELSALLTDNIQKGKLHIGNSIKIFGNTGWVLITSDKLKGAITVITESTSTEASRELCDFAVNKIKTCKKQKYSV